MSRMRSDQVKTMLQNRGIATTTDSRGRTMAQVVAGNPSTGDIEKALEGIMDRHLKKSKAENNGLLKAVTRHIDQKLDSKLINSIATAVVHQGEYE